MNYINLDFDTLYGEALALYRQNGGDILFPGDEKEMLLRTVLGILQQERASLNAAIAQGTIRDAQGEYLDILGENAGIARQSETHATGTAQITVQRGTAGLTIAEGTLFSYNGMLTFETTQAVGATAGTGTAALSVPIACTKGGAAGNGLEKGTTLSAVEPRAWLVSCVLTSATSGGIEKEEDEAYRARIIESTFRKNATGSRAQYKAVALAVSSAILDASPVAEENFVSGVGKDYGLRPGQVMVSLMFSDTLSEQEKKQILEDTWQALSSDESRPLTDTIVVREAKEKTYALKVRCKLQNDDAANEDRLSAVYSAQAAYEAWQSAAIGRAFDPYRLTSMLYNAGCSRVDIDAAESSFDGGEATYTEIDRATRITGRVNLEVQT